MTKQETAQQIVRHFLVFMVENEYLDIGKNTCRSSANPIPVDIAAEDIEQLQDIVQASIEEFMGYVAKGTLRSK